MKHIRFRFYTIVLALVATSLVIASCDDDNDKDSGSGTAIVGNITATFTKGALEYYGAHSDDTHNFDIYLGSSNVNFANKTGTGDLLYFELFTDSDTFNGGTFDYNSDETEGTFGQAFLIINGNWSNETAEHYFEITGGTVTVTKSGTYDITYTLTGYEYNLETFQPIGGPESISGSYSGSLEYFDYTDFKSKTQIKDRHKK